jgi:hypothetical protein
MTRNLTKLPKNIPIGHKNTNIIHSKALQNTCTQNGIYGGWYVAQFEGASLATKIGVPTSTN